MQTHLRIGEMVGICPSQIRLYFRPSRPPEKWGEIECLDFVLRDDTPVHFTDFPLPETLRGE